jgi:hypothetical protein
MTELKPQQAEKDVNHGVVVDGMAIFLDRTPNVDWVCLSMDSEASVIFLADDAEEVIRAIRKVAANARPRERVTTYSPER